MKDQKEICSPCTECDYGSFYGWQCICSQRNRIQRMTLQEQLLVLQLGTTGDLDASDYEKDGSTVERYSKGSEAVQALKAGQIDCVIIDSQPAAEVC